MNEVGTQIDIVEGQVTYHDGIRFGGSNAASRAGGQLTKIDIVVWDGKGEELKVTIGEQETFQIAGQTWRLDAIHDDGRGWYADLTRIA